MSKETKQIYSEVRRTFLRKYRDKNRPWMDYGAHPWQDMSENTKEFYRLLIKKAQQKENKGKQQ